MTDTDDALAARLSDLWAEWETGPPPTRLDVMVDRYPGGATGFIRDMQEAARRWVTSRAASAAGCASPGTPGTPPRLDPATC